MFTGIPFSQNAYSENNDSVSYLAEVRATFSSGENTPFWLVNNLQGLGSPEKTTAGLEERSSKRLTLKENSHGEPDWILSGGGMP